MIETLIILIIVIINSIVCFILGSYITAQGFKQEKPFERKRAGRVVRLTAKQKNQALANKQVIRTKGDIATDEWNKETIE